MKKNNLLPILLVAGAGVAAYFYFKNKSKAKEITEGVDIGPIETEKSLADQTTTTSEENEPVEDKVDSYIKTGTSIINAGKQLIKGRKKRRSSVSIGPTESSSSPFSDIPGSKKAKRKAARTTRRTTRKEARTTKRTTRKQRRAVKGFDSLSVLY